MNHTFAKCLLGASIAALAPRAAVARPDPCAGMSVVAGAPFAYAAGAAQAEGAATDVTLPPNSSTSGYITIINKCPDGATFAISIEPGSATQWLEPSGSTVSVPGKNPVSGAPGSTDFEVFVNTNGMQPGTHRNATITVTCISCPHCHPEGNNTYSVSLDVSQPGGPAGGGGNQSPAGGSSGQPTGSASGPTPGSAPTAGNNPTGAPGQQPTSGGSSANSSQPTGTNPTGAGGQQGANSNPAASNGTGTPVPGGAQTGGSSMSQGGNSASQGGNPTSTTPGATPTAASGGGTTPSASTNPTNGGRGTDLTNGSDVVPNSAPDETPILPSLLGGLTLAAIIAALGAGSGNPTTAQSTQTATDGKQPVDPLTTDQPSAGSTPVPQTAWRGDWDAWLQQSSVGNAPTQAPGAPPTPAGSSISVPPTPAQPAQPGGSSRPGMPTSGPDTVIPAAAGSSGNGGKPETHGQPTQPVATHDDEGTYGSKFTMRGPAAAAPVPAGPTPVGTANKPDAPGQPTQPVATPDDEGTYGSKFTMRGPAAAAPVPGAPGPVARGDKAGTTEKPSQPAATKDQDGAWGSRFTMKDQQHKAGDLNEGGGHTFSRGTTHEDMVKANRPPTDQELAAAKPGTGTDDYATREKKLRQGMADLRIAQEGPPPIAVDPTKPWTPTQVTSQPFVPVSQEDKDRLALIDKKIAERAANFSNLITTDPAEAMRNANLAKFWNDLKTHYGMLSKGLKEELEDLRRLDDKLAQARSNDPDKVWSLEEMVIEHEHIVYLYGTQGANVVDKYRQDEAEKQYYEAVPGMVAGGAALGAAATSGALLSSMPGAAAPNEVTSARPPATEEEEGFFPEDIEKAPEDPKGGWGTRMPLNYQDDSPPILTDPETGDPIPATENPETGELVPQGEAPGGGNQASASSTTASPGEADPMGKTQADLLPDDHMPAKGTGKTGFGNFESIPEDPGEKPGTRLPYRNDAPLRPTDDPGVKLYNKAVDDPAAPLNDPNDPAIDPQTNQPIPPKSQVIRPQAKLSPSPPPQKNIETKVIRGGDTQDVPPDVGSSKP